MAAKTLSIVNKGKMSAFVQSLFSGMWGSSGGAPRETYTGEWQSSSRSVDPSRKRSPLAHSAVYTCISNISSDIAKLPLRVMRPRDSKTGGMEWHKNHPLTTLFNKPNAYQTSLQFIQQLEASKLWTGNGYAVLFRDARGVPQSVHALDPTTVVPSITAEGDVWYQVKANALNRLPADVYLPARDIIHDRMVPLFHPLIGVSPLYAAGVSANAGNSISENSEKFFSNMSRSSGVLTSPAEIPEPVATRLKKEWDNNYTGLGFGKVAVLGSGINWTPLNMSAIDAQLIEQLRFTVEDIGRVYRVPSFMLGETKITYKNSEQLARYYFQGCLSYHIEALEQVLNQKFEMTGGSEVQFDLSPLFRMETDLRYDTHAKALNAGIKSINEVRAEEDLPPVTGGEEPRLQMQYVPLSLVNAQITTGNSSTGNAANETPADDDTEDDDTEDDTSAEDATEQDLEGFATRMLAVANDHRVGV